MDYLFGNLKEVKIEQVKVPKGSKDAYIQWLVTKDIGNEKFAVRHFVIKPNGIITHHRHKYTEVLVILKGACRICVNNFVKEVHEGDFVFINSYIPHELKNESNEDFEFICIISYEDDMSIETLQGSCGK